MRVRKMFTISLLSFLMIIIYSCLCACTDLKTWSSGKVSDHDRTCKELKHRILFNNNAATTPAAWQNRTEIEKLNREYNEMGC